MAPVISCRPSAGELGLALGRNVTVAPSAESPQADNGDKGKYFELPRAVTSTWELHISGQTPELDIKTYRLEVDGTGRDSIITDL